MKFFKHINADTLAQAETEISGGKGVIIAGGTDLLNLLKDNILPNYPETVINIKTIPGLDYIREEGNVLKIGAATRLADIACHKYINRKYTALAQAARLVATPHIRDMGTLGGNLLQLPRCWYFRKPGNRFNCIRKDGSECFAMTGENQYHSIFGALNRCIAVNPGDIAPALIALDAKIITTKRIIDAQDFWEVGILSNTVLDIDEIVTEIQVPALEAGMKSNFMKFALRKSIDFAIVNCAVAITENSARICLNAVAPKPYRAVKAEEFIAGKPINEANAEAAGVAAVSDARPLPAAAYKVQIAKTLVKRALLAAV